MEPPRIENNFSPSFLCPISAFSAFSARDSLTPRWAEHVKSGLLLRRPLSSDSQLQRLLRGIFPGQQCAFARTTPYWRRLGAFTRFKSSPAPPGAQDESEINSSLRRAAARPASSQACSFTRPAGYAMRQHSLIFEHKYSNTPRSKPNAYDTPSCDPERIRPLRIRCAKLRGQPELRHRGAHGRRRRHHDPKGG